MTTLEQEPTQQFVGTEVAVIAVDVEACFMPAEEGTRLGLEGYGELACEDGEQVVGPMNQLFDAGRAVGSFLAATRDWHRLGTAHIAAEGEAPNFDTTWPVHGVEFTPGAEFHAELDMSGVVDYKKGNEIVEDPKDDDSYTGANGKDEFGTSLLEQLRNNNTRVAVLGGLALNYCVKATALSLLEEGIDVYVASDATKTVFAPQYDETVAELQGYGVKFRTADELVNGLLAA